jgi:hypothetical protein
MAVGYVQMIATRPSCHRGEEVEMKIENRSRTEVRFGSPYALAVETMDGWREIEEEDDEERGWALVEVIVPAGEVASFWIQIPRAAPVGTYRVTKEVRYRSPPRTRTLCAPPNVE